MARDGSSKSHQVDMVHWNWAACRETLLWDLEKIIVAVKTTL